MQTPRLEPVVPYLTARNRFVPQRGDIVTVDVPGESLRVMVNKPMGPDRFIGTLMNAPISKGHSYRKDDLISVRRGMDSLGVKEAWVVISERDLQQAQMRADMEREEAEADALAAAEKVAAIRERDLGPEPTAVPRGTAEPQRRVLGPRRNKITRADRE